MSNCEQRDRANKVLEQSSQNDSESESDDGKVTDPCATLASGSQTPMKKPTEFTLDEMWGVVHSMEYTDPHVFVIMHIKKKVDNMENGFLTLTNSIATLTKEVKRMSTEICNDKMSSTATLQSMSNRLDSLATSIEALKAGLKTSPTPGGSIKSTEEKKKELPSWMQQI